MMIFPVPLSKRCTGAQTIGEIFSSIEVRDANILDIVMVVLCEKLPVQYALFTVVSNSYAKITFPSEILRGEVAEKGGNPEMEVVGLDISLPANPQILSTVCFKTQPQL